MLNSVDKVNPSYEKTPGPKSYHIIDIKEPLSDLANQVQIMKFATRSELKGLEETLKVINQVVQSENPNNYGWNNAYKQVMSELHTLLDPNFGNLGQYDLHTFGASLARLATFDGVKVNKIKLLFAAKNIVQESQLRYQNSLRPITASAYTDYNEVRGMIHSLFTILPPESTFGENANGAIKELKGLLRRNSESSDYYPQDKAAALEQFAIINRAFESELNPEFYADDYPELFYG